ncbi:hypothetical protein MCOR25_010789 [Pyricularia grisea]|uniref:Mid2 domain-containing protein n=1 Tax=Pyricularia grisea TaxID=148305 RepID=A0A6P8BA74_PYRGI|nr:uncharacterized protein PgNI_04663 [Pyricularia grisea]KAI6348478.1 hypothetical protein MCOR25_010789 [Pyricularia grisea]TLD12726.1 hypothetical protein PgNI_04663 [Pyricularia grisea]
MRLYSSSVLLLGATVLQYAELIVANTTTFDFDNALPKPQNGSTALFTVGDLKSVQPEAGLGVVFFSNERFRLRDVKLLQVPIGQQGTAPQTVARYPYESWEDIKMIIKTNSTTIEKPVPANTVVTIRLGPETASRMLANRPTATVTAQPAVDGTPVVYNQPAILYFELRYYPIPSSSSSIRRRQGDPSSDSGLSATTTKRFALTDMDRSDPKFASLVEWTNTNVPATDDPSTSDPSSGDDTSPPKDTQNPVPSPTVRPDGGANSEPASASSSSDGKLSTGAIAGIAVGAGLGFLLIAGSIAFCLLRRRRRNAEATHVRGYNGGGRSGDIIAEKEAANAAVSESGAHSPYSDDGRPHFQRDGELAGAGAGVSVATGTAGLMAAHHQDEQSAAADYAPYSDRPSNVSMADTAVGSASAIGTASSMPIEQPTPAAPGPASAVPVEVERVPVIGRSDTAMSGTYAHLVEDGMTAAEIARLEDEERQLDQAIERARGVTTK